MINEKILKDTPITSLLQDIRIRQNFAEVFYLIEEFLNEKQITNYNDLNNLLLNKPKFLKEFTNKYYYSRDIHILADFTYQYLTQKLSDLLKELAIETNQLLDTQPQISFPDYYDYGITFDHQLIPTLKYTDSQNSILETLIIQNPVLPYKSKLTKLLEKLSIEDLKNILRNADNDTPLIELGISQQTSKILIKSLAPYTKQVLRIASISSLDNPQTNIFTIHQSEKREIIQYQLKTIVAYLLTADTHYLFDRITKKDKKAMLTAANAKTPGKTTVNLINKIADYFTLEELQIGIFNPQVDTLYQISSLPKKKELTPPISRLFKE